MFGVNPKRQEPGQTIAARTINQLVEQVSRLARLTVGPGLEIAYIKGIPIIRLGQLHLIRDAYTTSSITARSGNVLGLGTAKWCYPSGTSGLVLTKTNEADFTVYNNTGGVIPSAAYGYVAIVGGLPRFIEADCMNTVSPGAPATP